MTPDELRTIVFDCLARYRDELPFEQRQAGFPFFVGKQDGNVVVFGGKRDPVFVVEVKAHP